MQMNSIFFSSMCDQYETLGMNIKPQVLQYKDTEPFTNDYLGTHKFWSSCTVLLYNFSLICCQAVITVLGVKMSSSGWQPIRLLPLNNLWLIDNFVYWAAYLWYWKPFHSCSVFFKHLRRLYLGWRGWNVYFCIKNVNILFCINTSYDSRRIKILHKSHRSLGHVKKQSFSVDDSILSIAHRGRSKKVRTQIHY